MTPSEYETLVNMVAELKTLESEDDLSLDDEQVKEREREILTFLRETN